MSWSLVDMEGQKNATLGARNFSSAVSGFCQVFIVTRLRPTAEDVSAFGQHLNFPPHARKTSGTQGRRMQQTSVSNFKGTRKKVTNIERKKSC